MTAHFPHLHLPHPRVHHHEGAGHPGHLVGAALAVAAAVTVGVGSHLLVDGDDPTVGSGVGVRGDDTAAALVVRPTADAARTGDAPAGLQVQVALEIPAGMRLADVALLDEHGVELAVAVPEDGVVRFDGLDAGSYLLAFTTTTDTVAGSGGTEISAMTIGRSGPVVLRAPASIVIGG
jgi:hypothetical protein